MVSFPCVSFGADLFGCCAHSTHSPTNSSRKAPHLSKCLEYRLHAGSSACTKHTCADGLIPLLSITISSRSPQQRRDIFIASYTLPTRARASERRKDKPPPRRSKSVTPPWSPGSRARSRRLESQLPLTCKRYGQIWKARVPPPPPPRGWKPITRWLPRSPQNPYR